VKLLLEHGVDPAVRNHNNQPPYIVAKDKETRNAFRRFMAQQPDRFDYVAAQVCLHRDVF
jgi:hypothetical protein